MLVGAILAFVAGLAATVHSRRAQEGKKSLVGVAAEFRGPKGFGRCRMPILPDASAASLRHHRLHHLGHLHISGDADRPDGLVITDRRGRRLTGCGRPRPRAT